MDIKTIGVEEWLNVWEKSATWDIAQSTISSLTMGDQPYPEKSLL